MFLVYWVFIHFSNLCWNYLFLNNKTIFLNNCDCSPVFNNGQRQMHTSHIIVRIACMWAGTHLVTSGIILICIRKFKKQLSIFRIFFLLYLGIPWISSASFVPFMLLFIVKKPLWKTNFQNLNIKFSSIKMVNFFRCY